MRKLRQGLIPRVPRRLLALQSREVRMVKGCDIR